MIRITKTEKRSHTIIAIDGQVSIDTFAVIETCCCQAESHGKPVQLFLRDVRRWTSRVKHYFVVWPREASA